MAVEFLKDAQVGTLYAEGEVAGFSPEVEAKLIKQKIAKRAPAPKDD